MSDVEKGVRPARERSGPATQRRVDLRMTLFWLSALLVVVTCNLVCFAVRNRERLDEAVAAASRLYQVQLDLVRQNRDGKGAGTQAPLFLVAINTNPADRAGRQLRRASIAVQRPLFGQLHSPVTFRHIFYFPEMEIRASSDEAQQSLQEEAELYGDILILPPKYDLFYYTALNRLHLLYDWVARLPQAEQPRFLCAVSTTDFLLLPAMAEVLLDPESMAVPQTLWLDLNNHDVPISIMAHVLSIDLIREFLALLDQLGVEGTSKLFSWVELLRLLNIDLTSYGNYESTGSLRIRSTEPSESGCSPNSWLFTSWTEALFTSMVENLLLNTDPCLELRLSKQEQHRQALISRKLREERAIAAKQQAEEKRQQDKLAQLERDREARDELRRRQQEEQLYRMKLQIRNREKGSSFLPDQLRDDDPILREQIRRQKEALELPETPSSDQRGQDLDRLGALLGSIPSGAT